MVIRPAFIIWRQNQRVGFCRHENMKTRLPAAKPVDHLLLTL